jgi:hypothetical protein
MFMRQKAREPPRPSVLTFECLNNLLLKIVSHKKNPHLYSARQPLILEFPVIFSDPISSLHQKFEEQQSKLSVGWDLGGGGGLHFLQEVLKGSTVFLGVKLLVARCLSPHLDQHCAEET